MKKLILSLLLAFPLTVSAQLEPWVSWASKDVSYEETAEPAFPAGEALRVTAWRGERVGVKALVYAPAATDTLELRLTAAKPERRGAAAIPGTAGWMRYVTTDNYQACGTHPTNRTPYRVADLISRDTRAALATHTARPVWCTFEVPADAKPGRYEARLAVAAADGSRTFQTLRLTIEVLDRTLPAPDKQTFHTDFWQQPYAVSRYHGVPRWSEAHWELLRPYLRLLARSGQRVATAVLFYEPWGDQSYDKFDPMVRTTRHKDGSWSYDYTVFDRWVTLCAECGIDRQINCYSMVPWDMTFRFYDEAEGREVDWKLTTDSPRYAELWTPFLKSFAAHLKEKGWYDRTCIAMDERGLGNMLDAYRVAQAAVPGIKMALAGTYHKELADKLFDYCVGYGERFPEAELRQRKERGWVSTTYTCCSTPAPNLFSNSLPAEAAWLPVHCVANGFDGYLHWSWMNWAENPETDSRYRLFAPGDTYLIYPHAQSSVRYERYMEGVALAEKLRLVRAGLETQGDTAALAELHRVVGGFASGFIPEGRTAADMVAELAALLNR